MRKALIQNMILSECFFNPDQPIRSVVDTVWRRFEFLSPDEINTELIRLIQNGSLIYSNETVRYNQILTLEDLYKASCDEVEFAEMREKAVNAAINIRGI